MPTEVLVNDGVTYVAQPYAAGGTTPEPFTRERLVREGYTAREAEAIMEAERADAAWRAALAGGRRGEG